MPTVSKPALVIPDFTVQDATPPPVSRTGRTSPYAPPEHVPGWWDALANARKEKDDPKNPRESAWLSFLADGLPTEIRARNALAAIRKAVASHGNIDGKALAGRVWEAEGKHYFAIQIRPGALS
jgi:hypothetical protein